MHIIAAYTYMAVCQNLVPLVNIKIAGKWMFIPLKMVLIGIDPYPHGKQNTTGMHQVQPAVAPRSSPVTGRRWRARSLLVASEPNWSPQAPNPEETHGLGDHLTPGGFRPSHTITITLLNVPFFSANSLCAHQNIGYICWTSTWLFGIFKLHRTNITPCCIPSPCALPTLQTSVPALLRPKTSLKEPHPDRSSLRRNEDLPPTTSLQGRFSTAPMSFRPQNCIQTPIKYTSDIKLSGNVWNIRGRESDPTKSSWWKPKATAASLIKKITALASAWSSSWWMSKVVDPESARKLMCEGLVIVSSAPTNMFGG